MVVEQIDLFPFVGAAQFIFWFRLRTEGPVVIDGWHVDDVLLAEAQRRRGGVSFFENFQAGLDHWLRASWAPDTNSPYAGQVAACDTVPPRILPDAQIVLVLARELNLGNAVNPSLTYRCAASFGIAPASASGPRPMAASTGATSPALITTGIRAGLTPGAPTLGALANCAVVGMADPCWW